MRIAGYVLLVLAALIVVPALTYAGYLHLDRGGFADPAGIKAHTALIVAGLGACIGGFGGAAVFVGERRC